MNEQEIRQAYQAAAEQETPSADLVNKTLLKMHEELEMMEVEKVKPRVSPAERIHTCFSAIKSNARVMITAGIACAAALCLLVLRPEAGLRISSVTYQEDMRMMNVYRSTAVEPLLPGWMETMDRFMQSSEKLKRTSYQFSDFAYDGDAPVLWAAFSTYDAPVRMQVTVSNFRPALYETLSKTEPNDIDGKAVYIGRDAALGDGFAVWEEGAEQYVQIRFTGGRDDDIRKGIEEIMKLPFESVAKGGKEN